MVTEILQINEMIRKTSGNNAFLHEAFTRIVEIANSKRTTILGQVTE